MVYSEENKMSEIKYEIIKKIGVEVW